MDSNGESVSNKTPLPIWLRACFQIALLGSIDPSVRMIAVSLSDERDMRVRVYMDREPNDDDREDIEVLQVEVDAMTSADESLKTSEAEIVFTSEPLRLLDPLDGAVYVRKER